MAWHALDRPWPESGPAALSGLLDRLRCIQLDPLDPVAPNAELVAHARIDGLRRGDLHATLQPDHAFEHFAKERCLIAPERFGAYRAQAVETPWWRATQRHKRVSEALLQDVLAEVAERGPLLARELSDHGRVDPIDWHGWESTGKAATMALQVLWRRCQVVVAGRVGSQKLYALPPAHLLEHPPAADFVEQALSDRLQAIGMLPTADGPQWSMLSKHRKGPQVQRLIDRGEAVPVTLPGSRRTWLAHPGLLALEPAEPDDRMRLLGPLDPLLWDRKLVQAVFGFEYLWEVYKPKEKRRWGWYVTPLLHRSELVGRVELRRTPSTVEVIRLWTEHPRFDPAAWRACLSRLEGFACG
ncbi:MAG: crosslink repair DNA glycosylase YcaQ family protein [Myxococcota bacterium]|nr:crosslink repair DNA glycosylase YcaQ family protein [Myxococcota bacterium]